jgi:hypothetical protein
MLIAALVFAAAQATAAPSFAGVTLGETESALISQMGEPMLRRNAPGDAIEYVYVGLGNTIEFVRVERGNVVQVAIKAAQPKDAISGDPPAALGITVGDPPSKVLALGQDRFVTALKDGDDTTGIYRGDDGLQYGFTTSYAAGNITQVLARLDPAKAQALPATTAPQPILHGGTSFDDAIIIRAPSESVGVKSEYVYLAVHRCADGGRWQSKDQKLQTHAGTPYDVLTVKCSGDNSVSTFYFNIAGYFGKS